MQSTTPRLVQEIQQVNISERPHKVALICDGQRLTYAQIDAMANRLANALVASGVEPRDRVLLCLPNSVELVVSVFAVLRANATFAIIESAAREEHIRRIATDCQATALFIGGHHAAVASRLLQELSSLRSVVLTGPRTSTETASTLSYDSVESLYSSTPPPSRIVETDLAYLIYTSGSTGEPKGVMITHKSALYAVQIDVDFLGLRSDDVIIDVLPLAFGYGFHQLLKTFRVGGTLVLERSFAYPAETLARMEAERVTGLPGIPTTFTFLLQQDLQQYDLSSVRYLTSMGAPLSLSLIRSIRATFPRAKLFSMYSLTEACNALGLDPMDLDQRPTSVGKPLTGTQAWLVDDEGAALGAGQIGELVVAGDHVRSGYWNDPKLSALRFRPGRHSAETLCFTGDLFRTDEDGFFYFLSRSDEIIKNGGRKVAPRQIEDVLYTLPGVVEAAVIGIPDVTWGHSIHAFVVLDDRIEPRLTERDIIRCCSQHLERFMVPRHVEIRSELPRTSTGKIKKSDLVPEVRA